MPRAVHVDPRTLPDDTPMKLQVLARAAFPDGSVTAAGLRREAEAGRLEIYRVAGVTMTTMAAIRRMIELCRVEHHGGDAQPRRQHSAPCSTTASDDAAAAQAALLMRLERRGALSGRSRSRSS